MLPLPKKAKAKARLFDEDNKWLVKEAGKRHTVVAVVIHELIENRKQAVNSEANLAARQRKQFESVIN